LAVYIVVVNIVWGALHIFSFLSLFTDNPTTTITTTNDQQWPKHFAFWFIVVLLIITAVLIWYDS